jgi:hypothetical protein
MFGRCVRVGSRQLPGMYISEFARGFVAGGTQCDRHSVGGSAGGFQVGSALARVDVNNKNDPQRRSRMSTAECCR